VKKQDKALYVINEIVLHTVGDGGFVTTSSLRSGQGPPTEWSGEVLPGPCIGGLAIDLATKQKTTAFAVVFLLAKNRANGA
jgi:hypothetical protein